MKNKKIRDASNNNIIIINTNKQMNNHSRYKIRYMIKR